MASIGAVRAQSANIAFKPHEAKSLDLLDFLFTQHVTQLSVCELLSKLADDCDNPTAFHDAAAVVDCFTEWLPRHEAIEEEQLLGMVGRCSLPGDDFDGMLLQLRLGHHESRALADELMDGLHEIATGHRLRDPNGFRATAIALCSHHRALVQWEDDVLYPLVRQRLAAGDLSELATAIASGKGWAGFEPSPRAPQEGFSSQGGTADPLDVIADQRPPARRQRH
jgi:hemerythrin-like domain-containing protein